MIIAANKADLCQDLEIIKKISDNVIPCSAETELLLRKASKAGIVNYSSGDEGFTIAEGKEIPPPQQKALDLVKSVFSKIPSTGIQKILNTAVFDSLKFIVVYPVEDETKLTNKDGVILPDTKLIPQDSTAKDLAGLIHADIAKGFLHAIDCKTKQRISGDQKLKNGDVIKIVSTLSRG
jgi:ribosome-binding ATPase YchF (GTP1/OBG family)